MTVTFKSAKREGVPLLIGLGGASGSGKTLSALMLAKGIADEMGQSQGRDGIVAFIDTERGRGLHYADDFKFLHGEINPPFRPTGYGDALKAAEATGAHVVVIDSFSHEWEGEGGVREWADELEAGGMKPPAQWKEPKLAHKRLVNQMLAAKPHIIVCMRAEEKMRIEQVPQFNNDGSPKMWNGKPSTKMVITPATELDVKERWVPICEKRFPYEITTSLLLTPQDPGVPIPLKLQRQHRPFFPEGQQITEEAGRSLARWSLGAPSQASTPPAEERWTLEDAELSLSLAKSLPELETAWKQKKMAPYRDQLQPMLGDRKRALTPQPQTAGDYDGA